MHDAYDEVAILKKLPLQIESVASFVPEGSSSSNLLLGTKVGHLLLYDIELRASGDVVGVSGGPGGGSGVSVRLLQSVKNFSKKPIVQIAVVPQYQILLCLTGTPENVLSVHDMTKARFPNLSVIEKTRGATLFTLNVKEETSQTGVKSVLVFLCVAVKKKLQIYYWKNREFHVLREDLCLPEIPKTIVWSGDSIFVGMLGAWKEYVKLSLTDGSCVELFSVGSDGEAKMVSMAPGRIGLMKDKKLVMLKSDVVFKSDNSGERIAQPTLEGSITWTESPVAMEYDGPYLIGVLPAGKVEIQTVDPRLLIQTLTIACDASSQKPRLLSRCQLGLVFLASSFDVWALKAQPFNDQIAQLLRQKQFELALKLSEFGTYPDGEREKLVQYIETLHAFDLFCKQSFQEAMNIFLDLDIDPSHVIGLFPDLLPAGFHNQLNYPDKVPEFRGHALEKGLLALKDYLVEVRNRLKNNNNISSKPIAEGSRTIGSKDKLLQIIDTTLVKCFLQTTDALVMPFLRLADNKCHLDETERALTKFGKLPELVILYKVKGQHRKALHLLQRQAHRPESALAGTERTVSYLQHLGAENLDLIFEFSSWVLQEFPDQGLNIFTDDLPEIEALPRSRVMTHVGMKAPELLLPYLEHVIFEWKDETPALHDALAERYQAAIQNLGQQQGVGEKLNETRKKLKQFLEFSSFFAPERVLMRLPPEGFHKERRKYQSTVGIMVKIGKAILYEKMGKHDRALAVYVYLLEDLAGAKAYCQRVAKKGGKGAAGEAFLSLLTLMISPPNASVLGMHASKFEKGREGAFCADSGLENAFQLLEEHPNAMDPCKVMKLLPPNVPLGKLFHFFKSNLYQLSKTRKELQLLKGLHYSQLLQVHVQRMEIQSQKIVLTDLKTCPGCRKRFLNHCAFAHYPNGDLVHYSCMEKYETLKL